MHQSMREFSCTKVYGPGLYAGDTAITGGGPGPRVGASPHLINNDLIARSGRWLDKLIVSVADQQPRR